MTTTFITGASSGIGAALARELAGRGHDLGLAARRTDALEELRTAILTEHPGRRVEIWPLDVTDDAAVATTVAAAFERFGGVDVVVANAGLGSGGKVGSDNFASDRAVIETNVIGAMATIDAAVTAFRKQGHGQVVAISSVAAARGLPSSGAYSASKAALSTYAESARVELRGSGITVTTLSPGFIDTPINEDQKRRPFLVDVTTGARVVADKIDAKVAHSTVPVWPWNVIMRVMRVLPTSLLARAR